ncbi:hypothetical protein HNP37_004378 [Flavobacterium nitrogenifigens]|uniref:PrcB C-terminal domain-containing protein n=2 Tax=Flavobacterium TaxID=237 RepID=A0A7W7J122_9FLAO|nr:MULTISPECIES: protease complex subunit PrcB family protein [Flavobacterium]MBB4804291.1 hypothetical protein [Flavobacterium nitrogenifigens]MBB6389313.1 hypothetical protein [Flavobacterium notoginsengisoli]
MKKLMLGLFVAFGISACSLGDDTKYADCGASTLVEFTGFPLLCNYSVKTPPTTAAVTVVGSQTKMDDLFSKHANSCNVSSDPNIDFTKNYLVGVFAGPKPTTGYSIKITSIVEDACQVVVNYYEKAPGANENVSQTPTNPFDVVLIPKTSKPFIFFKREESSNNIIVGSYSNQCTGADCQKFFQINDYNTLKFLNVEAGQYDFSQYKYVPTIKRGEYTLLLKDVPAEILALNGQTKTYGTPNESAQGGVYFELNQNAVITRVYIDNADTADQTAAIKAFKKIIQDKITSLK